MPALKRASSVFPPQRTPSDTTPARRAVHATDLIADSPAVILESGKRILIDLKRLIVAGHHVQHVGISQGDQKIIGVGLQPLCTYQYDGGCLVIFECLLNQTWCYLQNISLRYVRYCPLWPECIQRDAGLPQLTADAIGGFVLSVLVSRV
jgi:hypothetical protein